MGTLNISLNLSPCFQTSSSLNLPVPGESSALYASLAGAQSIADAQAVPAPGLAHLWLLNLQALNNIENVFWLGFMKKKNKKPLVSPELALNEAIPRGARALSESLLMLNRSGLSQLHVVTLECQRYIWLIFLCTCLVASRQIPGVYNWVELLRRYLKWCSCQVIRWNANIWSYLVF